MMCHLNMFQWAGFYDIPVGAQSVRPRADNVRPYMKICKWGASYFEGYGVGLLVRPRR